AAQPAAADCGRYRSPDEELQPCEFRRDERRDILDAARRPRAQALGQDVLRFSTRPELGGNAIILEVVGAADGGARVELYPLRGHPGIGWRSQGSHGFDLPMQDFRHLVAQVDEAIADRVVSLPDAQVVCTDGPGWLTERVHGGSILSLTGSCPPTLRANH